jgi:hypothetical protein
MVGDDDLRHRLAERREAAPDRRHLLVVDAAVLERERARGVDADDRDLAVDEGRLEVAVDDSTVLAQRAEEALPDAVERHVVVARDHQAGRREPGEEVARFLELRLLRALGQVARDDDEVGADAVDVGDQRLDQRRIGAAEVEVGEVDEGTHGQNRAAGVPAAAGAATTTRLAGRMR